MCRGYLPTSWHANVLRCYMSICSALWIPRLFCNWTNFLWLMQMAQRIHQLSMCWRRPMMPKLELVCLIYERRRPLLRVKERVGPICDLSILVKMVGTLQLLCEEALNICSRIKLASITCLSRNLSLKTLNVVHLVCRLIVWKRPQESTDQAAGSPRTVLEFYCNFFAFQHTFWS